jgi:hypothetical protein
MAAEWSWSASSVVGETGMNGTPAGEAAFGGAGETVFGGTADLARVGGRLAVAGELGRALAGGAVGAVLGERFLRLTGAMKFS